MEKNGGSSTGEPVALESDRHVYKSVLEGGDIPLQGLRALNKRHGSSSSSKGRMPHAFLQHLTVPVKMAGVYLFMAVGARCYWLLEPPHTPSPPHTHPQPKTPCPHCDGTSSLQTQMVEYSKSQAGIHVFPFKPSCWNPRIFFALRPQRFEPITSCALVHPAAFFYDLASVPLMLQTEARWPSASENWQEERSCLVKADGS